MTARLLVAAGYLDLPPSHKLALMKVCDSADAASRVGFPGIDSVRLWSGTKRSRAMEVLRDLQDWGLLMQTQAGHRGRRAEYKVFPDPGDETLSVAFKMARECPGAALFKGVPGVPSEAEVSARAEAGNDAPGFWNGSGAPDPIGQGQAPPAEPNGSGGADPKSGIGAGRPDPLEAIGAGPAAPIGRKGAGPAAPKSSDMPGTVPGEGEIGAGAPAPFQLQNPNYKPQRTNPTSADAEELALIPSPASSDPTFEDFYRTYPRKEARGDAAKAWKAAVKKTSAAAIYAGAVRFRDDPGRTQDRKYIPLPATWLRKERWDDDPAPPPTNRPAHGYGDAWSSGAGFGMPTT